MAALDKTPRVPRSPLIVFWALAAAFGLLVLTVLMPDVLVFFRPLFLSLLALCFLLGVALLILSMRSRERGLLRTFWILAGASVTGAALGSVLHNVFYALATVTGKWPVLSGAMEALEVVFFVIGTVLCLAAFLVGTVGAIVLLVRRGRAAAAVA